MDPLSITAGTVAVIQAVAAVIDFLNQVKTVSGEQRRLSIELCTLQSFLQRLRFRAQDAQSDDPWFDQIKQLSQPGGLLEQMQEGLSKIKASIPKKSKTGQLKSILTWKSDSKEISDLLSHIERIKSSIDLALSDDHFTLSEATQKEVKAMHKKTDELVLNQDDQMRSRVTSWLKTSDPSTNYHAALKKRHAGTGSWLLKRSEYQEWKDSLTPSSLWLHGKPGCGKTVLSSTVIEDVESFCKNDPDTGFAYYFFDFNDSQKQQWSSCLRSLVNQLSLSVSSEEIRKLYSQCQNGQVQPRDDEMQSVFDKLRAKCKRLFLVIDALDESTERTELMEALSLLLEGTNGQVHLLVTSRPEQEVREALLPIVTMSICIQSITVHDDISAFIDERLENDVKLRKWPTHTKNEIRATLLVKADGMFRWVFCQLDAIRSCIKPSKMHDLLQALPKTLDETYDRILQHIEQDGNLPDAIRALQMLCFSQRPLTLDEILDLLAVEVTSEDYFDPDDRLCDPYDLMSICSSLISIDVTESEEQNGHSSSCEVRLAHFSVQEYLLSGRSTYADMFLPAVAHQILAETCLALLTYVCKQSPKDDVVICCADYAAEYWWQHTSLCGDQTAMPLAALIDSLFDSEDYVQEWKEIYDVDQIIARHWSHYRDNTVSKLYLAAVVDLHGLVEHLAVDADIINASGGYHGTALKAASAYGRPEVVRVLLTNGAEVDHQASHLSSCETALQAAAQWGHIEVVQILLDNGANVESCGRRCGSALHVAASQGHETVVEILLDHGAPIDARDSQGNTALLLALSERHEQMAEVLLHRGADVNIKGVGFRTPLQAASVHGFTNIVNDLIRNGAEVNDQGGHYGGALQAAAAHGYVEIVEAILDGGGDINAFYKVKDGEHNDNDETNNEGALCCHHINTSATALQCALDYDQVDIVHILMRRGANATIFGTSYISPIQYAINRGDTDVVNLIVKEIMSRGANLDIDEYLLPRPLTTAALLGNQEIVQYLLDNNADIDGIGDDNSSALTAASFRGYTDIVQLLLERGANVNVLCGLTREISALQLSLYGGHHKIAQILLNAGASVNDPEDKPICSTDYNHPQRFVAYGVECGTALKEACDREFIDLVRELLARGASVDTERDRMTGSPLAVATLHGNSEVVEALLQYGVEPNFQSGRDSSTALYEACEYGHQDIAESLIKHGAQVNLGSSYTTPLQAAVGCGHKQIAELLIRRGAQMETLPTLAWRNDSLLDSAVSRDYEDVEAVTELQSPS